MALSQLQCLDDNHVNPRTNESKPEFLYCEDQRLALEALLRDGREAFVKYLGAHGMRGFLSDPELEALSESMEPYDPGSELFPENHEDDEPQVPLSLHYWPERSDTSVPQMDLGWPDSGAYRGVTRTTVYTQPPLEGDTHIKEVVRKMIAQAQKVIAVVMDVFTDVDIFRDLLDAGFRRKVSVYILLERTTLPHFQSMCQRANMHAGHLKHLRVRCTDGAEFYTRSCTKVTGRMGHRFMFVDGDKAVSGSYSFTWMSSRLDKNLITVVTGQAVEAFDRLFRILYATSSSVDLRQVATEPEPELEPLPQLATVIPPSAAIARKLYSPKYALVTLGNPNPALSADRKDTQSPEVSKELETKKQRKGRMSKEQEAPPIHPGLSNLEKACLMLYLPTWPEPDPPSDVIGFINIRDAKKPTQVHLQRSEMFETSQAIRFSSPISVPKETLPEVAKPRQLTAKHERMDKRQPAQDKTTNAKELLVGRLSTGPGNIKSEAEAPAQISPAPEPKCHSDTTNTLNTENKRHSNTPTNQDAHTPPQSSSKASTPNTERLLHSPQTAATLPGANSKKDAETDFNKQHAAESGTSILESSSTQTPHLHPPTDWNSNIEPHTQTKTPVPHTDSHTQAVHTQPRHSSEITPNNQTPVVNSHTSSSLTSATCSRSASHNTLSENSHISITTGMTTSACFPLSSISSSSSPIPPLTSSSTTPNPPLPSLTSVPPIPKPRTVQLVIKGSVTGDSQKLPEFSVVRKCETAMQTSQENVPETAPEQQNSRSKTRAQKDAKNTSNFGEAPQQMQSGTSTERKNEEADERYERAGMQSAAGNKAESDVLITNEPKADSGNIQEIIPKDMEPMTLTSADCKLTPQIEAVATVQSEIKSQMGLSEVPNENTEKTYLTRAHTPQKISYSELTRQDIDALETVDSLKVPTHTPVSATHIAKDTQGQHGNPSNLTPAHHTDSMPNAAKHNTHQELTPKIPGSELERSLRLDLPDKHVPELHSPTPEKESRSLAALTRTPTPEGFPPHIPDSRTHTPDFRTPTSDGYVSPRTDSALSTTSEEYYECSDSPFHDPVFDPAAFRNHGTTEDHVSVMHINTPNNGTTNTASPVCKNSSSCVATSETKDQNTSSSEAQSLSGSARVSSSSCLLKDGKGRKLSVAERRTEGQYQGTERRGSEDAKRSAGHFKQQRVSTETEDKDKETQIQAPKRKKVLNHSAADRPASGGELTNERTEPKRLSRGDLQSKMASSERKKADKEKAADRAALGASGVEKRGRPPSPRETDIQKPLCTSPKSRQGQQQDSPSRPPRPLPANQPSGSRPCGSRQLTQAERKVVDSSLLSLDNTSSPRQPLSRPPPPVTAGAAGLAADRKQTDVSHSEQSLLSRQPVAAQGRIKTGVSQNQHRYPKPHSSFLYTHSNREAQLQPHSQNQKASPQEEHWQEEGRTPFSFTFSKLYSLKGLKDKMSRLPASSKRGSASSPGPVRKSTS